MCLQMMLTKMPGVRILIYQHWIFQSHSLKQHRRLSFLLVVRMTTKSHAWCFTLAYASRNISNRGFISIWFVSCCCCFVFASSSANYMKIHTCPLSFLVLYPWHCFQIFSNIIVVGTCSLPLPLEVKTIDGRLTCAHGKQKNSGIGTIDLDVLPDPFWCLNWCPENWSYQNRSSSEPTLNISCPDASDLRRLHPLTY